MQGAVAGQIWLLHDPRYNKAEFGRGRTYWKGKLRAAAFAWAFSEQFEIGPLSEASIGHIQRDFPQQGFVDHVITPSIGLSWMIAEDALDRYVVPRHRRPYGQPVGADFRAQFFHAGTKLREPDGPQGSVVSRIPARCSFLLTSRGRRGPHGGDRTKGFVSPRWRRSSSRWRSELAAVRRYSVRGRRRRCGVPGGAGVADRARRQRLQDGGLPTNTTGDALVFQVGPRWTPVAGGKVVALRAPAGGRYQGDAGAVRSGEEAHRARGATKTWTRRWITRCTASTRRSTESSALAGHRRYGAGLQTEFGAGDPGCQFRISAIGRAQSGRRGLQ